MKYMYLLGAGALVSSVHIYLVQRNKQVNKLSLSEHAIADTFSHQLHLAAHISCDVLYVLFSYQFFIVENDLLLPHLLNMVFALLDFVQAVVPARGKTFRVHQLAAYASWLSYLASGALAFFLLDMALWSRLVSGALLMFIMSLFVVMHFRRQALYRYQLIIVPVFVLYMLIMVIGVG